MSSGSRTPIRTVPIDWSKTIPRDDRIGPEECELLMAEAKERGESTTPLFKYLAISLVDGLLEDLDD